MEQTIRARRTEKLLDIVTKSHALIKARFSTSQQYTKFYDEIKLTTNNTYFTLYLKNYSEVGLSYESIQHCYFSKEEITIDVYELWLKTSTGDIVIPISGYSRAKKAMQLLMESLSINQGSRIEITQDINKFAFITASDIELVSIKKFELEAING